ncbi:MAG TPA: transposase [Anaeromyxobacteraceae bacterium]|nr:transposase [Anaeromyxobacteraceae bacterium]
MTSPRQVLPGTVYLVTRRCSQRQLLLKPSAETNNVFRYVLAVAARRFGVRLHAFCVLSNHVHLIVTDPEARLPAFAQYLGSLVARALNASLGRWESFWAPSSYSAVALLSPGDIVEKTAYVLANPVAAGLVRRGREWPGLWSDPEVLDTGALPVPRPSSFFRPDGPMPDRAYLELVTPPGFGSAAEFREAVTLALAARELDASRVRAASGQTVAGVEMVLAQKATSRPHATEARRQMRPRVAGRDPWKRVAALARLADFLRAYRQALAELRRGAPDVLFPAGTYWQRVVCGVRCAAPV